MGANGALDGRTHGPEATALLTDVPRDYVRINAGLGASPPLSLIEGRFSSRARCAP